MFKDINVVFMGTPDFSVNVLEMLIENTNVVLVVTQPDKEVGRKKELKCSPVKEVALKHNIDIFQPSKLRNDFEKVKSVKPDLIITCAYGQILSQEVLDIPKLGAINVHASLLPKYRGAAPIQWSLLNGDEYTGITLMYMDAGMDTGDIFAQSKCKIEETDNVGTLHDKLSILGASLLKDNLSDIKNKKTNRTVQDNELATYAPMIKREDEIIDVNQSGKNIINQIRALNPWPLANLKIDNLDVKVLEATFLEQDNTKVGKINIDKNSLGIEVKDGIIYLLKIKPNGKKIMNIKDFLNGFKK